MDDVFFQISKNHKRIDDYSRYQLGLRIISTVCFVAIVVLSLIAEEAAVIGWILVLVGICSMFVLDCHFARVKKSIEYVNYYIETEALDRKKRVAEMRKIVLEDGIYNRVVKEVDPKINYPYIYYGALIVIYIIMGFALIF